MGRQEESAHGRTVQKVPKRSIHFTEIFHLCCTTLTIIVPNAPVKYERRPKADTSSVLN